MGKATAGNGGGVTPKDNVSIDESHDVTVEHLNEQLMSVMLQNQDLGKI